MKTNEINSHSIQMGLTTKEVEERKKKRLSNKVKKHSEKSYLTIILKNFKI